MSDIPHPVQEPELYPPSMPPREDEEWEPDLDHDEDDAPAWRNRWPTIEEYWP